MIGPLNGCHGLGYGKNDVFGAFQTILTSMFPCPGYQEDATSMNNLTTNISDHVIGLRILMIIFSLANIRLNGIYIGTNCLKNV